MNANLQSAACILVVPNKKVGHSFQKRDLLVFWEGKITPTLIFLGEQCFHFNVVFKERPSYVYKTHQLFKTNIIKITVCCMHSDRTQEARALSTLNTLYVIETKNKYIIHKNKNNENQMRKEFHKCSMISCLRAWCCSKL
jgi:alpha-glucosidase (family GH31 glycosyl hydrolase)